MFKLEVREQLCTVATGKHLSAPTCAKMLAPTTVKDALNHFPPPSTDLSTDWLDEAYRYSVVCSPKRVQINMPHEEHSPRSYLNLFRTEYITLSHIDNSSRHGL